MKRSGERFVGEQKQKMIEAGQRGAMEKRKDCGTGGGVKRNEKRIKASREDGPNGV